MEISKYISDALKDGELDKVSKGIEQLVIMMINAVGMIEQREMEFEKRLEILEEDIDLIKSFLLSKPMPLSQSTQPSSSAPKSPTIQSTSVSTPTLPTTVQEPQPSVTPKRLGDTTEFPSTGPTEDDITSFRKTLLKPPPKQEKPKSQPLSIRGALMQEIKQYFGNAISKVKKEKKNPD